MKIKKQYKTLIINSIIIIVVFFAGALVSYFYHGHVVHELNRLNVAVGNMSFGKMWTPTDDVYAGLQSVMRRQMYDFAEEYNPEMDKDCQLVERKLLGIKKAYNSLTHYGYVNDTGFQSYMSGLKGKFMTDDIEKIEYIENCIKKLETEHGGEYNYWN